MVNELARVVHYKPPFMKLAHAGWTVVVPFILIPVIVATIALAVCFVGCLVALVVNPSAEVGKVLCVIACGLSALFLVIAGTWGLTSFTVDDQIHISKDDLSFPLCLSPFLRFRKRRLWSEVSHIFFAPYSEVGQVFYGELVIEFNTGGRLSLDLSGFVDVSVKGFQRGELEKFLLAFDVFATNAVIDNNVIELRNWVGTDSRESGLLSYTRVWEEELSSRFHATVFVPLEPDSTLQDGKLKVLRQLAFGGLSAVYLVQYEGRELLILKEAVVPAGQDETLKAKALEMFSREASLLARLDHPRIARVYDHFVERGRNYLLLERITGENLRQVINAEGPQPERIVIGWAKQIAEILCYLHEHNPPVIHRDLTPENLILSVNKQIHLIDFGASNEFLGTVTGTVVGKQAFIPPEQFRGKATLSSDIYAFGGTLYFLLTGKIPVPMTVLKPSDTNPDISPELDNIVSVCTAQEQNSRPESARDLLKMFESPDSKVLSLK